MRSHPTCTTGAAACTACSPPPKDVTTKRGRTFQDLEAAHDWVTDRDDCTGKIGVIGYCLGGGFAVLLASMSDYAASSVNYGSVDDPDTVLVDACPIVASYSWVSLGPV